MQERAEEIEVHQTVKEWKRKVISVEWMIIRGRSKWGQEIWEPKRGNTKGKTDDGGR